MPPRPAKTDRSTRLAKALREAPPVKATPLDLYQLARRDWLAGERIDIGALAARLNIGRATAFRWVGSRDLLLYPVADIVNEWYGVYVQVVSPTSTSGSSSA